MLPHTSQHKFGRWLQCTHACLFSHLSIHVRTHALKHDVYPTTHCLAVLVHAYGVVCVLPATLYVSMHFSLMFLQLTFAQLIAHSPSSLLRHSELDHELRRFGYRAQRGQASI